MKRNGVPESPRDIQNGLEFFLPFSEEEKKLKEIWETHPEYHRLSEDTIHAFVRMLEKKNIVWNGHLKNCFQLKSKDYLFHNETIAVYKHWRYFPVISHSHDFFEVTLIVEGTCRYEVLGRKLELQGGDLVILPPGLEHSITPPTEGMLFFNILISTYAFESSFLHVLDEKDALTLFFRKVFYNIEDKLCLKFQLGDKKKDASELMFVLYTEYLKQDRYSNRLLETMLTTFFIFLMRFHEKDMVIIQESEAKDDNDIIFIMNYIQQQFRTATLQSTADFFNYSSRQMGRIIKKYTGTTFSELIVNLKMQHAEYLLKNYSIPVMEVCKEAGYRDATHFYRAFKEKNHCTPKEYREKGGRKRCPETP